MNIDSLNSLLGERLGYAPDGIRPRFKWVHSTESVYYFRPDSRDAFQRKVWSDRIGPCWMLCQWRPPLLSETDWNRRGDGGMQQSASGLIVPTVTPALGESFPYPKNGEYYGQPETALPLGVTPTNEWTEAYIHIISQQLGKTVKQHFADINAEIAQDKAARDDAFYQMVQETAPAFDNWNPGSRDGSVSFGGI